MHLGKTETYIREDSQEKKEHNWTEIKPSLERAEPMTENTEAFQQEPRTILKYKNKHLKKLPIFQKEKEKQT